MNVTLGSGKAVHYSTTPEGFMPGPDCGGNRATERYTETNADVTCKRCLTIMAKAAEAKPTTGEKEAPMAETTTEELTTEERTIEEVHANVERASSLAEAENVDALAELSEETEALISSLPSSGKGAPKGGWTKLKKKLRDDFKAAATVQEKPKPKAAPKAEVATLETKDYTTVEGVSELVTMGVEKVTDGVIAHIKTSSLAKDIASVLLDIRRRIHNKEGNPDLTARTDAAKKAASAIYTAAGESLGKGDLDAFDVEESVKKLTRAVQHQMSDAQAQYLRELDNSPEEVALFSKVLEGKPEDVPVSQWVANAYDLKLKGQGEIARERYHEKKALEAGEKPAKGTEGGEGEGEGGEGAGGTTQSPDEHVKAVVAKLIKDIKGAKPDEFESASEETKDAVRAQLEEASKALKAMITAVL